jgi:hypothetical protein
VANKGKGKPSKSAPAEHWSGQPEEHDYPAAAAYLSLICPPSDVTRLVQALQVAPIERRKAKDLLRASGLALLPVDNPHVEADLAKVKQGTRLSPVLLVRGDLRDGTPLTIADGYHRVCASYHLDEDADIPCHMADFSASRSRPAARARGSRGPTTVQ